jgi:hypothetical protein
MYNNITNFMKPMEDRASNGEMILLVGAMMYRPVCSAPIGHILMYCPGLHKRSCKQLVPAHHTSHFFTGFIRVPGAHWKSSANSLLLEKGPRTRNIPGECAPVLIRFSRSLGRCLEHQVLAALIQNIWEKIIR